MIAVVGATGAVGRQLLAILAERAVPVGELRLFASPRSEGKELKFGDRVIRCQVLKPGCFDGVKVAFFDASDSVSKQWVPQAAAAGSWVVDNSATFRLESDIPLIVPEVNGELLNERLRRSAQALAPRDRIVTGPNCSTVQMVVALHAIQKKWGLRRVVVSTYQSTSGAGTAAMAELETQTSEFLTGVSLHPRAFTHQIAFNCIPHIGGFDDEGTTSEERKMIAESRKILGLPALRISATAVRVPTFWCHGEAVNVECEKPFELEEVREALRAQPGIMVVDDPARNVYPLSLATPDDVVEGASGRDAVYVGRIRRDPSVDNGLNLWVVSDNLRKGAALNAIQIGETILRTLP